MNFCLLVLLGAAAVLAAPKCPDGYTASSKYYKSIAGKAKTFGVSSCKASCDEVDTCAAFTFRLGKCKKKKGVKTCNKGKCTLLKRGKKTRKCKSKKMACCVPASPPPTPVIIDAMVAVGGGRVAEKSWQYAGGEVTGKNAGDVTVVAASLAGGYITGQKKDADVFEAIEGGDGETKAWYVAVLDTHWKVTLIEVRLDACGELTVHAKESRYTPASQSSPPTAADIRSGWEQMTAYPGAYPVTDLQLQVKGALGTFTESVTTLLEANTKHTLWAGGGEASLSAVTLASANLGGNSISGNKKTGTVLSAADGGWYVVVLDAGYWKMMKLEVEGSCGMLSAYVTGGRYVAGKNGLPTATELDASWASISTYGLYIVEDVRFEAS
jgi:hypothetical protein